MATESGVKRAARGASPWLERLARLGFAAKSVVYLAVAGLCLRAAVGGTEAAGPLDAITRISRAPLGEAFLLAAAPAFGAYGLWRLSEAWFDPTDQGTGFIGIVGRIGTGVTGVIYGVLCFLTVRELLGVDDEAFGGPRQWIDAALGTPAGRVLFGLVAAVMVGVGVVQFVNAWTARFWETLRREAMGPRLRAFLDVLGRIAFGVWGVVFSLLGYHTARAAWSGNPREMQSVGGALRDLERQAYQPWPLLVVAAGLACFAVYAAFEARWRRIETH